MTSQIVSVRSIKKSGSMEESSNITGLKTITKLQAEIQKLKAIAAYNKAEYEENILTMRNDTDMMIENMHAQTEDAIRENEAAREEIKKVQNMSERMEDIEQQQQKEFLKIQEENDQLERSVEEATEVQRSYSVKYEDLESKIKQVLPMLNSMKEEQDKLMNTSKQLLSSYEKETYERKKTFQKVMSEENEMNRNILEGTGKELGSGLERNYMAMKSALNRLR
jgi:myosin heavy subunit